MNRKRIARGLGLFLAGWALNTAAELAGLTDTAAWVLPVLFLAGSAAAAGKWKKERGQQWLILLGAVIGLVFVLKLPYNFSWHDLAAYAPLDGDISADGHLGFIYALVHGSPTVLDSPMKDGFSVLYNPPLYHIVQALWLKLNLALGLPERVCLENLQVITWLCAVACIALTRSILTEAGLSEKGVRAGTAVSLCVPMLYILGATVNNDLAADVCILACLMYTLRWMRTRRTADIAGIALSMGCGMAVKLNTALLIPPVGIVFAAVFFRNRQERKRLLVQYALFLLLSVPEAVAWPLYHLSAYGMPLNYVRLPDPSGSVAACSLWQRFGFPGWFARRGMFFRIDTRYNHNVWMQTLSTSLFDEMTLFGEDTLGWKASLGLLSAALASGLAGLGGFTARCFRSGLQKRERAAHWFLFGYALLLGLYYVKFCLDFPYMCTFNARYVISLLPACALGIGELREKRIAGRAVPVLIGCFAVLFCAVWGGYFFL